MAGKRAGIRTVQVASKCTHVQIAGATANETTQTFEIKQAIPRPQSEQCQQTIKQGRTPRAQSGYRGYTTSKRLPGRVHLEENGKHSELALQALIWLRNLRPATSSRRSNTQDLVSIENLRCPPVPCVIDDSY